MTLHLRHKEHLTKDLKSRLCQFNDTVFEEQQTLQAGVEEVETVVKTLELWRKMSVTTQCEAAKTEELVLVQHGTDRVRLWWENTRKRQLEIDGTSIHFHQ